MRDRVTELTTMHDDAARDAAASRDALAALQNRLQQWSGTVERALQELTTSAKTVARGD